MFMKILCSKFRAKENLARRVHENLLLESGICRVCKTMFMKNLCSKWHANEKFVNVFMKILCSKLHVNEKFLRHVHENLAEKTAYEKFVRCVQENLVLESLM